MRQSISIITFAVAWLAISLLLTSGHDVALSQPKGRLVFIVNKKNPVDELSLIDIEKIYMGKRNLWERGKPIKMCDLTEENSGEDGSARAAFSSRYLKKDLPSLKSYWIKMIFSGRGQPPMNFSKAGDVIRFVAENKDAIGYVYEKDVTGEVKTLRISESTR